VTLTAPGSRRPDEALVGRRSVLGLVGVSVIGALTTFRMLSVGVTLSPDGWAFWEGSVSIINGDGYRYFGGQPIVAFPPLFSLYLGAVQWLFGVSGHSLRVSLVLLAAATIFIWGYLLCLLATGDHSRRFVAWIGAACIGAFVGAYYTSLVSETLFLPLLGSLLILEIIPRGQAATARRDRLFVAAIAAVTTLLLLTRNASLAFLPAIACLTALRFRVAAALFVSASSLGVWSLVRVVLDQSRSHAPSLGGRHSFGAYLSQLATDVSYRFSPLRMNAGFVLVLCILAVSASYAFGHGSRAGSASRIRHLLGFLVIGTIGLLALFNLTWVNDPLSGRFIWYLPLLLVVVLAAVAAHERRPLMSAISVGLLVVATAIQCERTLTHVIDRSSRAARADVQGDTTIRPDYFQMPMRRQGDLVLVSPPEFPWISRSSGKRTHTDPE